MLKAYKTAVMINPDGMYVLENMKNPTDVENDAFIQSEARKQNIIPNTPYYFDFIASVGEYIREAEFREANAAAAAAAAARRRQSRERRRQSRERRRQSRERRRQMQGGSKMHSNRRKRHSNRRKRHSNTHRR
jgi:hypothetical protein